LLSVSDPYKTLQVDPEAEDEVIEAAYRRLARKYHPDVSTEPDSHEKMIAINQARELLRDPVRRAALDRARLRARSSAAWMASSDAHAQAAAAGGPAPAQHRSTPAPSHAPSHAASRPQPAPNRPGGGTAVPGATSHASPGATATASGSASAWASGRVPLGGFASGASSRPDGEGAAGPPPGNPSGSVLTFGRYTGWSLGEIARTEVEYLEWLDRMPIGRPYQQEIDAILRAKGLRSDRTTNDQGRGGPFRRR
jgi:curved DNA-binding protein CbpA